MFVYNKPRNADHINHTQVALKDVSAMGLSSYFFSSVSARYYAVQVHFGIAALLLLGFLYKPILKSVGFYYTKRVFCVYLFIVSFY